MNFNIAALVPEEYSRYRHAIADVFQFFVERLPPAYAPRAGESSGSIPDLIEFARESPTLHKLGQVMARNPSLSSGLRSGLQTLESYPPRLQSSLIFDAIARELGDAADELVLGPPLAEASVALVVPFSTRPDRPAPSHTGVLKVLKPGIRERVECELAIWMEVGAFLNDRCHFYALPELDFQETFESVGDLLRNEIMFTGEQTNLETAAAAFRGVPGLVIPRLLPYCTANVTAMERIEGVKITEMGDGWEAAARALATRVVEGLIASPLWSKAESAIFHADPHAGNLYATSADELAVLDWAIVGRLSLQDRADLAQVAICAASLDGYGVCRALENLCQVPTRNPHTLREVVDRCLQSTHGVPGLTWLMSLLDSVVADVHLRFSRDLLLLRKSMFTLRGVINSLAGPDSLDLGWASCVMSQMFREWPARSFLSPMSRSIGTRVSNWDLWMAGWNWSAETMRRSLAPR